MKSCFLFLFVSALCASCAAHTGEDPSASSEEALTDFARLAGIVEGSSEAAAVRAVVNDTGLTQSDYVSTVGLASATAAAIVSGRPFSTLAQLNGVSGASTVMFVKLQTYARSAGISGVVHGSDRVIALGKSTTEIEVEKWGRGLWEGYVSFDVSLAVRTDCGSVATARLVDALAGSYPLSSASTRFERLPLPVQLFGRTTPCGGESVSIKNVSFEVTRTNPIAAQSLTGQYQGTQSATVTTIGKDIPGVQMTLTASAQFFQNFTNGNSCDTLRLNNFTLSPASASQQITVTAPLTIQAASTCISARLPKGQAEDANDFTLGISAITLGDPHS